MSIYHVFANVAATPCICESTLCLEKNDTDVAGYIFNAHQPILVVFGRDVGERVCY